MKASPLSDVVLSDASSTAKSSIFKSLPNRLHPSPETLVLLLAIFIGGGTGLAVVLFHYLIEKIHGFMLEDFMGIVSGWGGWTLALVPSLGGVVVGLMRWRWHDFGATLSSIIASTQSSYRASPLKASVKAIAASVSLGTGASLGPEGPSVEIGANVGLLLGQVLKVSQERQRLLLGAGAAAGLSAGFNAPIAGVFFALEVVLGTTFATSAVSVVLLSAVVAALISQIGLGSQPAFTLPSYEVRSPLELPLYLGLGLFASFIAIAYTQAIQLAQRFFRGDLTGLSGMAKVPVMVRPMIGGIGVGIVALQFPQILGIGYETIEAMLRDVQIPIMLLLALIVIKLVMTAVSIGSGLVGGLFAPAMFLGASLGAAYGKILPLLPLTASMDIAAPPAYAMVGMAAVLAASVRAPLTAILLLFELTRDYRIILPLMAAVGLSVWIIERVKPISERTPTVQTTELKEEPNQELEMLNALSVGAAMHEQFVSLSASLSVVEGALKLTRQHAHSGLVFDDDGKLVGILSLQDINRAISGVENNLQNKAEELPENKGTTSLNSMTVDSICTKALLYAYKHETLAEAKARMSTRGLHQLPVIDEQNPDQVLGILDKDQIALACNLAITQRALQQQLLLPKTVTDPIPMTVIKRSA